jgi:cytochrome c oxidase subunit III
MSDAHAVVHDGQAADDGHAHEAVYPYTPHHFHEAKQHFESGKMGVWLFLVTEILFFAGLFCAYTVYRAQHPEIFYWAHFYLDTTLGAANTIVLILSSFTAAWAVRNAQLGQQSLLRINIVLTICGALFFMCVKYVEYSHKFHDGLLPSRHFKPTEEVWETHHFKEKHPESAVAAERIIAMMAARKAKTSGAHAIIDTVEARPSEGRAVPVSHHEGEHHAAPVALPAEDPAMAALPDDVWLETQIRSMSNAERRPLEMAGVIRRSNEGPIRFARPDRAGIFFSIYFFMTGLHGIHVVVGIGLWLWMLAIASKRKFGAKYFGPIEFTALYWHLVDLIWIYLFPMLYLIH